MELHSDRQYKNCIKANEENDGDQEQEPKRSNRTAAVIAKIRTRNKIEDEQSVPIVEQNYEYLLLFIAKNGSVSATHGTFKNSHLWACGLFYQRQI